jgi:hypothetical protein
LERIGEEADAFPGGCWLLRCEGRDRLVTVFRAFVTELEIELTGDEKLDDAKTVRRVFGVLRGEYRRETYSWREWNGPDRGPHPSSAATSPGRRSLPPNTRPLPARWSAG